MGGNISAFRQQVLALGATLVGFADVKGVLEGEFARWPLGERHRNVWTGEPSLKEISPWLPANLTMYIV